MIYPTLTPLFLRSNGIDENKVTDTDKRELLLELYEHWIATAIDYVGEYCQQPLIAASREHWFHALGVDGFGLLKILPFTFPVTATLSTRSQIMDGWATVSTAYYRIVLRDKNYFLEFWNFTGGYYYRLNCTVGYTESTVPTLIQKIIIDIASWIWKESQIGRGILGVETQGTSGGVGHTTTKYVDMPIRFKTALQPYRMPS